jgi:putative transposase
MLKAIHAQESRDAAHRKARTIVEDLHAATMHTAADLVERSVSETLTYYAFPDIHWQKIRTNKPLERIRRTRVVGAFLTASPVSTWLQHGCATSPAQPGPPNAT